jgi:hypothetical protein
VGVGTVAFVGVGVGVFTGALVTAGFGVTVGVCPFGVAVGAILSIGVRKFSVAEIVVCDVLPVVSFTGVEFPYVEVPAVLSSIAEALDSIPPVLIGLLVPVKSGVEVASISVVDVTDSEVTSGIDAVLETIFFEQLTTNTRNNIAIKIKIVFFIFYTCFQFYI